MAIKTQPKEDTATGDFKQLALALLETLDGRSRDIMTRRFGLRGGRRETLEGIGTEYGITRERVRQIEAATKKTLAALSDRIQPAAALLDQVFSEYGGLLTESHAVQVLQGYQPTISANVVHFYLEILLQYQFVNRHPVFQPHWQHREKLHDKVEQIVAAAEHHLKTAKTPAQEAVLFAAIRQAVGSSLTDQYISAALVASKQVDKTVFEEWGLAIWSEVAPRGVGDKAYAVLRRHGKPEHFRSITTMINGASFDTKKANPQTVHNELIKDSRFVLVGRGLYGLTEWGFMPGTVADVLERILRDAEEPLSREELVAEVMKQRLVKRNTILLGLQNNKRFVKTPENRYTLREK